MKNMMIIFYLFNSFLSRDDLFYGDLEIDGIQRNYISAIRD